MSANSAISIILPSYNYAHHLREAVDSILAQTHSNWELLIIDDGSQDDSVNIAQEYAAHDPRISVLQHPDGGNHGLAATVLLGLKKSRHPFVAFLESDDIWEPESLALRLPVMLQPGTALTFNAPKLLVESDRALDYYQGIVATQARIIAKRCPPHVKAHELMATNLITGFSCVMASRDLLLDCDFSPPSPPSLDKWLWQQLSLRGTCCFVSEALTIWRLHGQSYIATHNGDTVAEDRRWQQSLQSLLAERSFSGPGLWLARHVPRAHCLAVRVCLKLRAQGLSGVFRAIRKRLR